MTTLCATFLGWRLSAAPSPAVTSDAFAQAFGLLCFLHLLLSSPHYGCHGWFPTPRKTGLSASAHDRIETWKTRGPLNFDRCAGLLSQLSTKAFDKQQRLLNVRQSTLSRGLRDLEHRLGAILFERTNGGTRPTPAGEEFLDAARRMIKEAEAIAARVKMRSRGESGRLTIGVHASLSAGNLRATLIEHHRRFPEVHTHLIDGSSDHLISNLAEFEHRRRFRSGGQSQPGRQVAIGLERTCCRCSS